MSPIYLYNCDKCHEEVDISKPMKESQRSESCLICGERMRRVMSVPVIQGTRDGFGIKNAFRDPESGKMIETWKDWENAGYKQAKDTFRKKRSPRVMAKFKEKQDRIKFDSKKRITI